MAVPRFNRTSNFEGLLVAEVDLQPLTALLAGLQANQTVTAYLVDTTGQFIVGSDSGLIQPGEDLSSLPLVRDYLQQSRTTAPQLLTGLLGEAAVGRYAALDFPEWAIIVELPAAEAYGAMRLSLALAVGSTVLIVLLVTWLSIYLARQTAAPLATLTQRADRVVDGRFNQIMPVVGTTEIKRLANAFNRMTLQVRELIQTLEERVAMRTQRLEMITTISSQLSTILSLDDLLLEVVERIQTSFNFYHAHIYFMDDQQQRLMVVAGTGTAGARMKADHHSIPLNAPTSLVARAARTGQVVWVNNVRERADWLPNELLPNTRAEMAVPILLGDQVVGVLDVQQDTVGGLDDGDASLLRSLANHVAVAIRNARLFAEVEAALAEAKMAQSHYLQQAWHPSNQVNAPISGEYHGRGQSPLSDIVLDQLEQAAHRQAGPVVLDAAAEPSEMGQQALIAPIKLHGLTIGTMQFYDVAGERSWDERELALIDVIAGQVAQAAENIRLIEEMRERSSRERTIREFTDKLRATPNLDALLSTATRELAERLNVRHAVMEIGIE
jgi:GAF domain-containing protein/HAMP domain-containing protein